MIELSETIYVDREPAEAFAYLADFCNTVEWDATAEEADKLTPGPVAPGTLFRLRCALPLGSVAIDYTVLEMSAPERLVLRGTSSLFDVTDEICLLPEGEGTVIEYRARFELGALLRPLERQLRPGMERMGGASAEGLRAALADDCPSPAGDPEAASLATRLASFTRYGYRRSRRQWHPVSASLSGRHAVITGATSGLGKAAALALARLGASLTLVARERDKAEQVRAQIAAETGNPSLRAEIADLSLLAEVDALCARLCARGEPVDILVNNAGALFADHALTAEGIERSVALLLLSPYRLTLGLRPLLEAADGARVVNVLSGGMYTQRLSLQALAHSSPETYSGAAAYAQAKRALMAATQDWAAAWDGAGIVVNAMHPGWVDTPGLAAGLPRFHGLTRCVLRTPEQGADTIVWLAAATEAAALTGKLFLDRAVQPEYLTDSTRESAAERAAVLEWLRQYEPPEHEHAKNCTKAGVS